ncbi:MAG: hypothetical protein K0U47_06105 [Epsilonproteobacteria bacterium]|nr:hypothetical protein [Campylobacterota bacterium]
MNTLEEKLNKAKAKLMLEHPYFGSISSMLKLKVNENIESFESDGNHFSYNDDYLFALHIEEIEFTLANASMHYALSHQNRMHQREGWLWQLATDYAINAMLIQNNMFPPARINHDPRFEGMYAEEIYAILKHEIDEKEFTEQEEKFRNKEQVKADDNEPIDEALLEQIHQKIKEQGELPKALKRLFPELYIDSIDWRAELHRYLNVHAKEDYQFFPPNKKYIHQGFALPSLKSELLKIVVAIDTSGSIDIDLLATFFAHFQSIMESFKSYEIDLIECDAKIQAHRTFYPGDMIAYNAIGGGGTDFRPLFAYVDTKLQDAQIIIYFTDGFGSFPKTPPTCDVLWVMPEKITVPFGEVLQVL